MAAPQSRTSVMRPSPNEVRRTVQRALAAASEAFLGGDTQGMAQRLREAWRDSRDPSVAALYELLLRSQARALPGRNPAERAHAWRETATRDAGDPLVLAGLLDEPSHDDMPEFERLGLLSAWTPDPLLSSALVRRLQVPVVPREH